MPPHDPIPLAAVSQHESSTRIEIHFQPHPTTRSRETGLLLLASRFRATVPFGFEHPFTSMNRSYSQTNAPLLLSLERKNFEFFSNRQGRNLRRFGCGCGPFALPTSPSSTAPRFSGKILALQPSKGMGAIYLDEKSHLESNQPFSDQNGRDRRASSSPCSPRLRLVFHLL